MYNIGIRVGMESIGSTELLALIIHSAIGASVGICRPRLGYAFVAIQSLV